MLAMCCVYMCICFHAQCLRHFLLAAPMSAHVRLHVRSCIMAKRLPVSSLLMSSCWCKLAAKKKQQRATAGAAAHSFEALLLRCFPSSSISSAAVGVIATTNRAVGDDVDA